VAGETPKNRLTGATRFDSPARKGPSLDGGATAPSTALKSALRTFRVTEGTRFTTANAVVAAAAAPQAAAAAPQAAAQTPVDQAAQRVRDAHARGGTAAASQALEAEARALGSPEQVDALLQELAPTVDAISADLAHRARHDVDDSGEGASRITDASLTSLAAVAELASDEGVEHLAGSLGQSFAAEGDDSNLNQFDDRLGELAEQGLGARLSGALALDLITNRGLLDAGNAILNTTTEAVDQIRGDYAQAQGELAQLEQRLAGDLAAFGSAMTPEQRQAYTDAFWATPERADVRNRAGQLGDQLAETLREAGPALEALAARGDEGSAKALFESYLLLASSDEHATSAIEFTGRLAHNPALAAKIDEHTDGNLEERLSNEVLAQAMPRAQAHILAAHADAGPQGAARAAEELDALFGPLSTSTVFSGIKRDVDNLRQGLQALARFRDGASWDLARAQTILQGWDQKNPFMRSMAVVMVGYGIFAGAQAFGDGNYPEALRNFLSSARGGVEVAAGLVGLFSRTAHLADDVARVGGKFLPAVGLALDAVQLAEDIGRLRDGGADAGEIVSLVGTGISLVGDVLEFVPGAGTVLGGALGVVGSVVHALGGFISGFINGDRERRELEADRRALLGAAELPQDVSEALLADPDTAAQLANLGFTREQYLGQIRMMGEAYNTSNGERLEGLHAAWRTAALLGLQGAEADAFVRELSQQDVNALRQLNSEIGPGYFYDPDYGGGGQDAIRDAQENILIFLSRHFSTDFAGKYGLGDVRPEDANIGFFSTDPVA
jgi:hypothetical protein